jgi:hypothetical protein
LLDAGRSRRQPFIQHIDQSLSAIRKSIEKVKLHRFEETVRYIVTDGLQAKIQNILSGAKFVARPVVYSVAPIVLMAILRNVLTSSSSEDYCCDCSDDCDCDAGTGPSYTTTTTQQIINPQLVDRLSEGATGGLIGGGGGILVNEIASRMRGSTTPPAEAPTEELFSPEEESEMDREIEEELGPDTDEPPPPTKTVKTPPVLPPEPPELPPKEEPPKTPVKREDWLRDRETGKRPDTKLPPGVPKVDIQPPEDPADGVKIASGVGPPGLDLPADPSVAMRNLWESIQKGWDKVSEVPDKVLDAVKETEDGTEPQPPKVESEQEKGPEIPPEARKVLDGMKDSFGLPKPMTEEQRAAYDKAMQEAGSSAVDHPAFGTGSELSKGALDKPVEYSRTIDPQTGKGQFTDVESLMRQVARERAEATGTDQFRAARDAVAGRAIVSPSPDSVVADRISKESVVKSADFSRLTGVPDHAMAADLPDARDMIDMHGQPYQRLPEADEAWDAFVDKYGRQPDIANRDDQRRWADMLNDIAKKKGKDHIIDPYSIPRY